MIYKINVFRWHALDLQTVGPTGNLVFKSKKSAID